MVRGASLWKDCTTELACCSVLQVWLAKCKPLDEDVALKIIEMDNMTCDLVRICIATITSVTGLGAP